MITICKAFDETKDTISLTEIQEYRNGILSTEISDAEGMIKLMLKKGYIVTHMYVPGFKALFSIEKFGGS